MEKSSNWLSDKKTDNAIYEQNFCWIFVADFMPQLQNEVDQVKMEKFINPTASITISLRCNQTQGKQKQT